MNTVRNEVSDGSMALRWIKRCVALAVLLLFVSLVAIWVQNRPRVVAFDYLRRDLRTQALLDTWTIAPSGVLASFPETESVIGVQRRGSPYFREIIGVAIINARLVGPKVNDADLEALQSFPELEYLELVDTSVTDAALDAFQRAVPACKVVRRAHSGSSSEDAASR